jgi:molybdate transport system regulatory protein
LADPRKLRLRILFGPEIAVGPGKVALLDAIAETGSISAAARALGMSYRRAWLLIDTMNRCFREPVIETASGGKGGGGASITAIGEEVLRRYRTMEDTAVASVSDQITEFSGLLADEPPDATSRDEPA